MDLYSILRELADSWVLLLLTLFFIGVVFFAFRPGSRTTHDDIANIPFRNDNPASFAESGQAAHPASKPSERSGK